MYEYILIVIMCIRLSYRQYVTVKSESMRREEGREREYEKMSGNYKTGQPGSLVVIFTTLFSLFELCSVLSGIFLLVNILTNLGSFCLAMVLIRDIAK